MLQPQNDRQLMLVEQEMKRRSKRKWWKENRNTPSMVKIGELGHKQSLFACSVREQSKNPNKKIFLGPNS
jgi:hypothetical protein